MNTTNTFFSSNQIQKNKRIETTLITFELTILFEEPFYLESVPQIIKSNNQLRLVSFARLSCMQTTVMAHALVSILSTWAC
jgi:hypothetical protein